MSSSFWNLLKSQLPSEFGVTENPSLMLIPPTFMSSLRLPSSSVGSSVVALTLTSPSAVTFAYSPISAFVLFVCKLTTTAAPGANLAPSVDSAEALFFV